MKNKQKTILISIATALAFVMTLVIGSYYTLGGFFSVEKDKVSANVRTVQLSNNEMDYQAILNEFEDSTLTTEGTLTTFTGYQALDPSVFEEIDNLSESDVETLAECKVGYKFTYDTESNVVTIYASIENELGEIEMDTISGVGFINEDGEIDAVMNVDGEGVLLSEMRNAGMIQNCGWFSNVLKKALVGVLVAAVVVASVALIVYSAGTAAPALMAAATGVTTSTVAAAAGTAAVIYGYATLTAAIAAGAIITIDMWEQYYPGIKVEKIGDTIYAKDFTSAKEAIKDIVIANQKTKEPEIYFECVAIGNAPAKINMDPCTFSEMTILMSALGASSVTYEQTAAMAVIRAAVPVIHPLIIDLPTNGVPHYQAIDVLNSSYNSSRPLEQNQRYKVANRTLHSFWCI